MPRKISRRDFLKFAGATTLVSVAACGGVGVLATQAPDIAYVETHLEGVKPMSKILIAYATRAGSTGEVAKAIGEVLSTSGATVDVQPLKSVTDLRGYNAFVVGSAIRMGKWLPEAVQFVQTNQATLSKAPTAYFLVSGFLREDTPEMRRTVAAFLDPVRKIMEPASVGMFAGKMDYSKLSWLDRTIAQMVKSTEGDFRNWEAIRAWAREVQPILSQA